VTLSRGSAQSPVIMLHRRGEAGRDLTQADVAHECRPAAFLFCRGSGWISRSGSIAAIDRAHAGAALRAIPGKSRRNSTAAASSPPWA